MTMDYILALDQGTTSSRAIAVRSRRATSSPSPQHEFPRHYPQPGWVEHDPLEIWRRPARRCRARRWRRRGVDAGRRRRDRHHQPARNHASSGTARPASRSATPSSGRTAAPPASATHCARPASSRCVRAQDRPACSTPISPPPSCTGCSTTCPARARARRARRARLRHRRQLAALAADRRARVHATDVTQRRRARCCFNIHSAALGRRAAARSSTCRARCCRRCVPSQRASTARPTPDLLGARDPDRRRRRRPAGRALRPGLLHAAAWPRTPTAPAASC